jgi:hypothetical protein
VFGDIANLLRITGVLTAPEWTPTGAVLTPR